MERHKLEELLILVKYNKVRVTDAVNKILNETIGSEDNSCDGCKNIDLKTTICLPCARYPFRADNHKQE